MDAMGYLYKLVGISPKCVANEMQNCSWNLLAMIASQDFWKEYCHTESYCILVFQIFDLVSVEDVFTNLILTPLSPGKGQHQTAAATHTNLPWPREVDAAIFLGCVFHECNPKSH